MKAKTWMKIGGWCLLRYYRKKGFTKHGAATAVMPQIVFEAYRSITKERPRTVVLLSRPEKGKSIDVAAIPAGSADYNKDRAALCWSAYQHFSGRGGEINVKVKK